MFLICSFVRLYGLGLSRCQERNILFQFPGACAILNPSGNFVAISVTQWCFVGLPGEDFTGESCFEAIPQSISTKKAVLPSPPAIGIGCRKSAPVNWSLRLLSTNVVSVSMAVYGFIPCQHGKSLKIPSKNCLTLIKRQ